MYAQSSTFSPKWKCHCAGIMTDLLVYSIVIPVLPFQLENLGYENVSGLVGWLLFGYVCRESCPQLESPTNSLAVSWARNMYANIRCT